MTEKSKKSYCLQLRVYSLIIVTAIMFVITYQSQDRPAQTPTIDLTVQK